MLIRSEEYFCQESISWRSAAYCFSFDRKKAWEKKTHVSVWYVASVLSQNFCTLVLFFKFENRTCQPVGKWCKECKSKQPIFKHIIKHLDLFFSSIFHLWNWGALGIGIISSYLPCYFLIPWNWTIAASSGLTCRRCLHFLFYGLLVAVLCFTFNLVVFAHLLNIWHKALLNTLRGGSHVWGAHAVSVFLQHPSGCVCCIPAAACRLLRAGALSPSPEQIITQCEGSCSVAFSGI